MLSAVNLTVENLGGTYKNSSFVIVVARTGRFSQKNLLTRFGRDEAGCPDKMSFLPGLLPGCLGRFT